MIWTNAPTHYDNKQQTINKIRLKQRRKRIRNIYLSTISSHANIFFMINLLILIARRFSLTIIIITIIIIMIKTNKCEKHWLAQFDFLVLTIINKTIYIFINFNKIFSISYRLQKNFFFLVKRGSDVKFKQTDNAFYSASNKSLFVCFTRFRQNKKKRKTFFFVKMLLISSTCEQSKFL